MNDLIIIPPGYRFQPKDEELIYYLLTKLRGLPLLPWNVILDKDLYDENTAPWDVFGDIDESSHYWHTKDDDETSKTIYVFTRLKKVGPNCRRISRKAGCGTWDGQTGARMIKRSTTGEIIGSSKMFTFQHAKKSVGGSFGRWIMYEYSMDGVSLNEETKNNDLVLCKIIRHLPKNKCSVNLPRFSPEECVSNSCSGAGEFQINLPPLMNGDNDQDIFLSSNKRSAEAFGKGDGVDVCDHKKARSNSDDIGDAIDQLLAVVEMIENVDVLFQGLDEGCGRSISLADHQNIYPP